MKRELSVYLDLVRFLAAMVVFVGHLSGRRLTGGFLWEFGSLMDAAVVIFFVLSGYVIAYTADMRENSPRAYAISRLARIYSVALPAVLLAVILDGAGQHLNPDLYQSSWGYVATYPVMRAASLLTFTNELWGAHVTLGSLLPYWSLGYEVWYYILFGIVFFLRSWPRVFAAMAVAVIMGPKIILLFPIWLFGAAAYLLGKSGRVSSTAGWSLFLGSTVGGIFYILAMCGSLGPQYVLAPTGLAARLFEGAFFSLNLVGFQAVSSFFALALRRIAKPVQYLAGMTFSLYLIHLPLAQFIAAVSPFAPHTSAQRALVFGGTFLLVVLFSQVTERQKRQWRDWIETIGSAMLPLVRRPVDFRKSV